MDALLLIDLQNDFLPGGALGVPDGEAVIPVANRLMKRYSLVVATQDWHPENHGSFAANHPSHAVGDIVQLAGLDQVLWPVHCVQHTRGAQLAEALDTQHIRRIFTKGEDPQVDSYSGFFDNHRRHSTGLGEALRAANVTDVYILGLATDYCVKASAIDARQLGFQTHLVIDGCRGVNLRAGDVERALEEMRQAGVQMIEATACEAASRK